MLCSEVLKHKVIEHFLREQHYSSFNIFHYKDATNEQSRQQTSRIKQNNTNQPKHQHESTETSTRNITNINTNQQTSTRINTNINTHEQTLTEICT